MTNALSLPLSFSLCLSLSLCPSLNDLPDVCRSALCAQRCGVVTPAIRRNLRFVPDLVSRCKPQTREPGRDCMNLQVQVHVSHNVPTARQMSSQISLSRVRCSYPKRPGVSDPWATQTRLKAKGSHRLRQIASPSVSE